MWDLTIIRQNLEFGELSKFFCNAAQMEDVIVSFSAGACFKHGWLDGFWKVYVKSLTCYISKSRLIAKYTLIYLVGVYPRLDEQALLFCGGFTTQDNMLQ